MFLFISGRNASNKDSYLFLRKELPVRLANIMKEFSFLPDELKAMPSLTDVTNLYKQSMQDILEYETKTGNDQQCLDK